jgi:hypothetical protein
MLSIEVRETRTKAVEYDSKKTGVFHKSHWY